MENKLEVVSLPGKQTRKMKRVHATYEPQSDPITSIVTGEELNRAEGKMPTDHNIVIIDGVELHDIANCFVCHKAVVKR